MSLQRESEDRRVRPPAVAGMFYPLEPELLRSQIDALLAGAKAAAAKNAPSPSPKALIVPHAGYPYSGPIAASAYATLAADVERIERVVLIGPAHRVYVPEVAADGAAQFRTPLGNLEVDEDWLDRDRRIEKSPRAHALEHSLEVQLPFLQRLLPKVRIAPLLVSDAPSTAIAELLERLWGGSETRVIVSSDLSHYLPYDTARTVDAHTAERILSLDDGLSGEEACGCAAVNGLLLLARRKHLRPRLLDLRNSGDTAGRRNEVVGYGAFAFYEESL